MEVTPTTLIFVDPIPIDAEDAVVYAVPTIGDWIVPLIVTNILLLGDIALIIWVLPIPTPVIPTPIGLNNNAFVAEVATLTFWLSCLIIINLAGNLDVVPIPGPKSLGEIWIAFAKSLFGGIYSTSSPLTKKWLLRFKVPSTCDTIIESEPSNFDSNIVWLLVFKSKLRLTPLNWSLKSSTDKTLFPINSWYCARNGKLNKISLDTRLLLTWILFSLPISKSFTEFKSTICVKSDMATNAFKSCAVDNPTIDGS